MLVEDEVRGRALERPDAGGEEEIVGRIPRMNRGDRCAAACSSQGEQRPRRRLALLAVSPPTPVPPLSGCVKSSR